MSRTIAALLALSLVRAPAMLAYSQQFQSGHFLRWPGNAQIIFKLNSQFAPNNPPALVRGSLLSAFTQWNTALSASGIGVRLQDGGDTDYNQVGCDGINLVTFTNTQISLPPGVLGIARVFTAPGPGPVTCGSTTIQAQFGGQIIDADLIFNPSTNVQFSTVGLDNTVDVEGVALHEIGHWLGLDHSGINSAVMAPAGDAAGGLRRPHTDDIAGINAAYGVNAPGGAISGRVTDNSGIPVLGGQVVATNNVTGITTAAALSDSQGNYRIVGLAPASYRVFVEPLDNPINLLDVSAAYQGGNTNFATTFLSNPVNLSGPEASGVNFQVGPKVQDADGIGVFIGGGGTFGPPPISVKRGVQAEIRVFPAGSGVLTGDITFSAPTNKVTPVTGTTMASQGSLRRTVQIAADAALGAIDVYTGAESLTGSLQITVNPVVGQGGVVEGAAYNRVPGTNHFTAGSIISIFGTDLAEGIVFASVLPLPTQLGGVSVKVGGRFAPLFYVSPTQINAMVPYEVSGSVPVQIVAGNNSLSNSAGITLSSSAPRIFTTNSQGTGQGAILNANNTLVDGSNPAGAGDVVVIFCEGLGLTNPVVVSGVASPAVQIPTSLRVLIGSRDAAVQYKGLAPTFAGLYQVNAVLPQGLPAGTTNVQLINSFGDTSNVATIVLR